MRPNTLGLAFAFTAALSASACASRRAPPPSAATTPPPLSETAPGGTVVGAAPINTVPADPSFGAAQANIPASGPGSRQDFVAAAGSERVYFATDSHDLTEEAGPIIQAQAAWLQRYPGVLVTIEGNADERGTREYNLGLGARRAQAVRERLIQLGLRAERVATISYGKERPVDTRSSAEGWAINRNARTNFTGSSE
jgi:peptidoglycan-associated lipoprotein